MDEYKCDILIVGGGTGGVAAAIQSVSMGCKVILLEETSWLGGQMTSQGVSALDEHPSMDLFGGTKTYYHFRENIRKYYTRFQLSSKGQSLIPFNPSSNPNRLCFEPHVGAFILENMLKSVAANNNLTIYFQAKVIDLFQTKNQVHSVTVQKIGSGHKILIIPSIIIDASELGDLFPLVDIPYRTGKESFADTLEPSASNQSMLTACQSFTYTFAVERRDDEHHTIPKPELYEEMRKRNRFTLNGFRMFTSGRFRTTFWNYRLLIDASNFDDSRYLNDISLINFLSMDYDDETILDQPEDVVQYHFYRAKQLSLSYLYWLQTEAPREEGGQGYPELKLRKDLMGSKDGLSQYPYIRESRRLKGLYTIKEQDIVANYNNGPRAVFYPDSVGIGWYQYIDIHKCCHSKNRIGSGQKLKPFQIPLGAMITDEVTNVIAGSKNISTTHITNSAYRFHPVEWNIGESAGVLAAFALRHQVTPLDICRNRRWLKRYQIQLLENGIPLYWYTDVPIDHPAFMAVQYLAMEGILSDSSTDLLFYPNVQMNSTLAQYWLIRLKQKYKIYPTIVSELLQNSSRQTKSEFAQTLFARIKNLRLLHPSL